MIDISNPVPGLWALRIVSNGPEVAARIYWAQTTAEPGNPTNLMDRGAFMVAEINGAEVQVDEVWLRKRRPIGQREYDFLVADRAWARAYSPYDPVARPFQKVTDAVRRRIPAIRP